MNYTIVEIEIALKLKELRKQKKYTALSLWPGIGNTTIGKEDNRLFINEGRDGKWNDVTEAFYDDMVNLYDSRNSN
jgi:hypothetical protein